MQRDATQFAEANLLEAYYFVTADRRFSNRANKADAECAATVPSELPFVQKELRRDEGAAWLGRVRMVSGV